MWIPCLPRSDRDEEGRDGDVVATTCPAMPGRMQVGAAAAGGSCAPSATAGGASRRSCASAQAVLYRASLEWWRSLGGGRVLHSSAA
jgi:hypothetical protein